MSASQSDITRWFGDGQMKGATHLIVVYDASKRQSFPVYVMPGEDLETKRKEYNQGSYNPETDFDL
jgi:hypothetical protein